MPARDNAAAVSIVKASLFDPMQTTLKPVRPVYPITLPLTALAWHVLHACGRRKWRTGTDDEHYFRETRGEEARV